MRFRFRVRGGGPCVLEGISFQGDKLLWQEGKVKTKIHQTVSSSPTSGNCCLSIALPPKLLHIHDGFHISMLRKYVHDPMHVINHYPLAVSEDLSYIEKSIEILDRLEQVLRNKVILLVWVLWKNHTWEELTWERKDEIQECYPFCLSDNLYQVWKPNFV